MSKRTIVHRHDSSWTSGLKGEGGRGRGKGPERSEVKARRLGDE